MSAEKRRTRPNFFTGLGSPALLFALLVFLVPIIVILLRSVTSPGPENYADAIDSGVFLRSIWTTLRMAVIVTIICLIVSYPYAYALARSGPVLSGILLAAVAVSFWTSILVRSYAWQVLLNNTGLINTTLQDWGLIDGPLPLIRNDFSVYVGMVHILAPFTILTIFAQLRTIAPDLEKAALSLGSRPSGVFFRVTLPLSLPGAAAGGILVFVLAMGFYITPEILGSAQNSYLGSVILQQIQLFLKPGVGAAQAAILLAVVLVVLAVAGRWIGLKKILGIAPGKGDNA